MEKQDLENMKNIKFTITDNMKGTIIEMLIIKQMLDECELTPKERKLLQKHFAKLTNDLSKEVQAYNQVPMALYLAYMSGVEEIDI